MNCSPHTGVSWVKLPVWYGASLISNAAISSCSLPSSCLQKTLTWSECSIIRPADLDFGKEIPADASIADLLSNVDSSVWLPSLDEVLTRLSLRVRWWQLGIDQDTSYAHFPNSEREIRELREKLFRFGQDVSLGIGWPWLEAMTISSATTWNFEQMSAEPQLTGDELASYLSLPIHEGVSRWTPGAGLAPRTNTTWRHGSRISSSK